MVVVDEIGALEEKQNKGSLERKEGERYVHCVP